MNPIPSRRTVAAGLLAALVLGAHAPQALAFDFGLGVAGSGTAVTEVRPVAGFHGLSLATGARVEIRQGEVASVEVMADDNVAPLIATEVKNGTLTIEDRQSFRSKLARVTVVVARLGALSVSGSTSAAADGLSSQELSVDIGGSSSVSLRGLSAQRLQVAMGGSSVLRLAGTARDFKLNIGGSASLDARGLEADSVTASAGGSSASLVRARDRLTVSAGGSSLMRYQGKPVTSVSVGGSATVVGVSEVGAK